MLNSGHRNRYALDVTGINPDNLVCELHVILDTPRIRVVSPIYGAYFSDSLKIWDNADGRQLVKGVDFRPEEFSQAGFLETALDVYQLISILNPLVSKDIRVHRQILGGHWASDTDINARAFQAAANDVRPVHFDDIAGFPEEVRAAWHDHSAGDVLNWGALIAAVDRLRNTVNIGNTHAFQTLINYVDQSIRDAQKIFEEKNLPAVNLPNGFIDERGLSMSAVFYMLTMNAVPKIMFFKPVRSEYICSNNTGIVYFELSTNIDCPNKLYTWRLEHRTTEDRDFEQTSGPMVSYDDGDIVEILINNYDAFHRQHFSIGVFNSDGKRISLIMGDVRAKDYSSQCELPDERFLTDGVFNPEIDLDHDTMVL